jgi:hypothetical protein
MSKLVRALMLGAMLVAMNLAAATAVAQHRNTDAAELFRAGERAARQERTATDAAELFRAGERAAQAHRDEAGTTPAQATRHTRPDGASQRPGLLLALSVLAALAAMTARRATRRVRARQAV